MEQSKAIYDRFEALKHSWRVKPSRELRDLEVRLLKLAVPEEFRLHGPFVDNTFKVRHVDTCRKQCSGCGKTRIKMTADLAVLRRHWTDRVLAQYKGGVLYAMRKTMWNCLGQWARQGVDEDYDLTVNVGLDGRYCVRAGGRANETRA